MHMQDKDMDALFRSKLEDFEAEPSVGVWGNINQELHGVNGSRKSLTPLLGIAASVFIFISAGLFFLIKDKKAAPVKPDNKLVQIHPAKHPAATTSGQVNTVVLQSQVTAIHLHQQLAVVRHSKAQLPIVSINAAKPAATIVKEEAIDPNQQILAATAETKISLNRAVVPDTQISPKLTDTASEFIAKPSAVLVSNLPVDDHKKQEPAKKHKIRGLGGFINAVVASVDKRQNKIIEFTDTDEGDSVTGINLGIIKIKKQ